MSTKSTETFLTQPLLRSTCGQWYCSCEIRTPTTLWAYHRRPRVTKPHFVVWALTQHILLLHSTLLPKSLSKILINSCMATMPVSSVLRQIWCRHSQSTSGLPKREKQPASSPTTQHTTTADAVPLLSQPSWSILSQSTSRNWWRTESRRDPSKTYTVHQVIWPTKRSQKSSWQMEL